MDALLQVVGLVVRGARPRGRHLLAAWLARRFGDRALPYRDRWGYRHVARLGDPMQALGFVGKPALPRQVGSHVGPGDWVVDVGANIGVLTAALRHRVGEHGLVWAVEPYPPNVRILEDFVRTNRLANVTLHPVALSARNGVARLAVTDDGNSGHPSLVRTRHVSGHVDVPARTLDELVESGPRDRTIALLKLDVEGHEPAVLDGAARTLSVHRPAILVELNDEVLREAGSSAALLLEALAARGFRPTEVFREGRHLATLTGPRRVADVVDLRTIVVDVLLVPT